LKRRTGVCPIPSQFSKRHFSRPDSQGAKRDAAHSNISAFHQVETFLLSLTEANEDGRVLLISEPQIKEKAPKLSLRYILLNPADHFSSVLQEARSIILAGGTMAPVSERHKAKTQGWSSYFAYDEDGFCITDEGFQTALPQQERE
jgi:Rad3-related DNA helicase